MPSAAEHGSSADSWNKAPILIAGGGIGGLALALALARRGIASSVLEAREALSESGAGIQIGPNGVQVLRQLGVADRLESRVGRPEAIVVRSGKTGRLVARLPLGDWIERRHGAPYWVAHRRDLQAALLAAVAPEPFIAVEKDFRVHGISEEAELVRVRSASGEERTGRALFIADGLHSGLRHHVVAGRGLRPAGRAAYRTVIGRRAAGDVLGEAVTGLWLAPGAHVVHYPVEGGASVAVVAIVPETGVSTGWSTPASWTELKRHVIGFAPRLTEPLSAAPNWRRWSLACMPAPPPLARGRLALVGDAGHPMLPFLAQGGVMALEDAVVAAGQLAAASDRDGIVDALAAYDRLRRPRVARVMGEAARNGRIYHLSGPLAAARDFSLRLMGPERLMARYDWLYGWRPPLSTGRENG